MNNLLMRQCADVPMGGLGQYADVATGGFGPRVGGSVCGACCGMTLVLGSMAMIVWNEGHAVAVAQELDVLSREVVSVGSRAEEANMHAGLPVHLTGDLHGGRISDNVGPFTLTVSAVILHRSAAMYQWAEHVHTRTEKNGGITNTYKDYTYTKQWAFDLKNSQNFRTPGHDNPAEKIGEARLSADPVTIGGAVRPSADILRKVSLRPLPLDNSLLKGSASVVFDHVALAGQTAEAPEIGDQKVYYEHCPNGHTVSVIGRMKADGEITGSTASAVLPLVADGRHGAEEMIRVAVELNTLQLYFFRALAFFLIFAGMSLCMEPLNACADFIPVVGSLTRCVTGVAAFLLAVVVTLVTVAFAWLYARPLTTFTLLATAAGVVAAARFMDPNKGKKFKKSPYTVPDV
ncbi:Transmembrane protein 43-like protein [Diplonema papillatum]|nr:Transmembrane protein 43-like protein [Diplonema papillatum]